MSPKNHWLYGHIPLVIQGDNFQEAMKLISQSTNQNGLTGLWVGRHRVLSVSEVTSARTVLQIASGRNPPPFLKRCLSKLIGQHNLITLNGSAWKSHRGTVARTFNADFLQESRRSMTQVAEIMVQSLKKRTVSSPSRKHYQVLDVEAVMKIITMDIFGRTALSTDLGGCQQMTSTPLVKAFEFLLEDQMDRIRSPLRPRHFFYCIPTDQNKRHRREREIIRSFVADLLTEKRDILNEGDRDLLSRLVLAHGWGSQEHSANDTSFEALTDILMTLLLAGHHTTSATLAFALYLLAKHPEKQRLCVEEIKCAPSLENIESLIYCSAVIWETLRLFPPATRTSRCLDRPVALAGFAAPKGTRVSIPIWSIQHDETNFPQPESFRPDRWASRATNDGNVPVWHERPASDTSGNIPAGNRKAMLAFSAGARSCVGQNFALQEAVIVLATLLKELEFKVVPGYELKSSTRNFIQRPDTLPLIVMMRSIQD